MKTVCRSIVFDISQFGISKISNFLFSCDADPYITIKISFDSGNSWRVLRDTATGTDMINKEISSLAMPYKATPKIVVSLEFDDTYVGKTPFLVKVRGNYANLLIGTTLYFYNSNKKETFTTNVGEYGSFSISLPRGQYRVSYLEGKKVVLLDSAFIPESIYPPTTNSKDSIIESLLRDADWAEFALFDTFENATKIDETKSSNFVIGVDNSLSDGYTDRKVSYWALLIKE